MYGAMREHAPNPTRLAGVITAGVATLAFGYAMANGMGRYVASILPDPITYVVLPDETPADRAPPDPSNLKLTDTTLTVVTPEKLLPEFTSEPPPITGSREPIERTEPKRVIPSIPAPPPIRTKAQMLPYEPPPYPNASIRAHQEGISGLEICLDPRGRVTAASLAKSSGYSTLDQAALKWVRTLKFTPAKVDGTPQAICGHTVNYEWTLKSR